MVHDERDTPQLQRFDIGEVLMLWETINSSSAKMPLTGTMNQVKEKLEALILGAVEKFKTVPNN